MYPQIKISIDLIILKKITNSLTSIIIVKTIPKVTEKNLITSIIVILICIT
jgi:hypothetical protein